MRNFRALAAGLACLHIHYFKLCERTLNVRGFPAKRGSGGALGKTPNRLNATASVPRIPTLCQYQNVRIRPALESIVGALLDDREVSGAVVQLICLPSAPRDDVDNKVTILLRTLAWKRARSGRIIAPMKTNHLFAVRIVTLILAAVLGLFCFAGLRPRVAKAEDLRQNPAAGPTGSVIVQDRFGGQILG